ncbi:hypothetical protein NC652_040932 [Populus alba x Populus x berolinensis]|nr:hypothetical protein NC652_040932 [Populus alba x Populus x berolinensis]
MDSLKRDIYKAHLYFVFSFSSFII